MRIRHPETIDMEEELYRQNAVGMEGRKALPIIVALLVIALLTTMVVGYSGQLKLIESYGAGNPYNCESCKALGRACNDHRNFDKKAALNDKIALIVNRYAYDGTDEDQLYAMYGYDNNYNTDCDFCNASESECYSCSYDRRYIVNAYNEAIESEVFITKLCDECWEKKIPNCEMCKEKLVVEIISSINKEAPNNGN